ncbi:MAG: hypothetical protein NZ957_05165 [Thaumarchaeota archaeon]|nr:hypothetical protein [Candidatus Calditenuaceae archaeon]MDW8042292.1 hypothetical protein [Nitrososphaerota archaeon]
MASEEIKSNVLAALAELAFSGTTLIKPMFDSQSPTGVSYPDADMAFNTKGAETEELLDNLHRAGILKRTLLDVIRACPVCGHVDVEAREACPSCKSLNLTVEDRKVVCINCGTVSQSPEFLLHCGKCGNLFPQEAARLRPLFAYLIAKSALMDQRGTQRTNVIEITGKLVIHASLMDEMRRVLESMTERIEKTVNKLIEASGQVETIPQVTTPTKVFTRTGLSPALRKTLNALSQVGSATAEEVASLTGRTRPLESVYLNQLVYMGYVTKERKGQRIYFRPLNPAMVEMK